ncbi:MAG TPA: GNAT family N-acetyltransferase [Mycobacteriales bacterium]|jgi:ribosomal protein S18 acetylase RimI-like enzyme
MHGVTLAHHDSAEAAVLMDQLCDAYADAYGAPPGEDAGQKRDAFRDRATKALEIPNYSLVTAHAGDQLIGFVFGYSLPARRSWWDGLQPEQPEGFTTETGSRTVVLAEIEVRRAWQGRGVGRRLHDAFLSGRNEERATLATNPKASGTQALYERWGWQKAGTIPGKPGAYYSEYLLYVRPLPIATPGR